MKTKIQNLLSAVAVSGALVSGQSVFANQTSDFANALAGASVMEMPAKAADLVSKSSPADKQNASVAAVKAAVGLTPSAAPAVVSAIARENPAAAAAVAVASATLQHNQIKLITKAAVAAAPSQVAKIVAAMIKEFPKDYSAIAIAASGAAPSASREILAVLAEYVPSLQAGIQLALAGVASGDVSVAAIINQASPLTSNAPEVQQSVDPTPSLSAPSFGSPFTTVPGTVKTSTPAQTMTETAPQTTYARP